MKRQSDFREFVFTATGKDTDLDNLTLLDAYDNLAPELDRIAALCQLLEDSEGLDDRALDGVALLLKDTYGRMRTILETALHGARHSTGKKGNRK
jgi:hypothetical protein